MYQYIFFTNVLRILSERGLSKHDLAETSGVSISFISDITTGDGNPSLKKMQAIATALNTPLPELLETTDVDNDTLEVLSGGKKILTAGLPPGYERVNVVLPDHRAFIVKKWAEEARKKITAQNINEKPDE